VPSILLERDKSALHFISKLDKSAPYLLEIGQKCPPFYENWTKVPTLRRQRHVDDDDTPTPSQRHDDDDDDNTPIHGNVACYCYIVDSASIEGCLYQSNQD
jgi:hypothetical protein